MMKETLITWLDRFLVLNVFLVIFAFFWLAIALIGRYLGMPLGWEIWYQLWQPLFNPAIAILFLGAILSWLVKKVTSKISSSQE